MNTSRKIHSHGGYSPLRLVHSVTRNGRTPALGDRQTRWSLVGASAILSVGFVTTAPGFLDLGAFYSGTVHLTLWATLVLAWSAFHGLYKNEIKGFTKSEYAKPFYIALGMACLLFYSVGTGNRIADEGNYWTGLSQSLHQNHTLGNVRGPALYPFLASIVHSIVGYKDQNMFWINFVACVLLFTMMIRAGERITKNSWYGIVSVLFLASFPMFGVLATSNTPDTLNAVLVAAICYQIVRFIQEPGLGRIEFAFILTLLAAQCNPASALFMVPIAILAYKNRKEVLGDRPDLKTALLPVVAIPVGAMVMANGWLKTANTANVGFFTANLRDGLDFLLNRGGQFPISSQIFTLCAITGVALIAANWPRIYKTHNNLVRAFTYFSIGLGLVAVAAYAYANRSMGHFVDARTLLVYLPILALCATYPLHRIYERGVGASVVALLVIANFCYQVPNHTRSIALNSDAKFESADRSPATQGRASRVARSRGSMMR